MKISKKQLFRKLLKAFEVIRYYAIFFLYGIDQANLFLVKCSKETILKVLIKKGAKIGNNCDIETGIRFHNCSSFTNLTIGNNCHIGKDSFFDLKDRIIIGHNVTISMKCTFITHQDMGKSVLNDKFGISESSIIIEDNVYIGVNSTILQGVKLGSSSVIAACSLVREDTISDSIYGGIPAKHIKNIVK